MPTTVQFRRGTTAQNDAFTGAAGELSIDTDLNVIRVHDNSTAGGEAMVGKTATQTLTNKTLTSPTINSGTVGTALTFNAQADARFADSDSSNWVAFQGPATIASNITWTLPNADGSSGQALVTNGSGTLSWAAAGATISSDTSTDTDFLLYFASSTSGALTAVNQDSGLTYNPSTGKITASAFAGALTGNVTGDVTGNADTATALATARTIGGVSFDGTANINLAGVNTAGNQDTSGNAATATALATARTIAGNSFDGTANITIASTQLSDSADLARLAAPAFTGTATGVNLTLSGDLTVNGTTTTLATTNTVISDNLIELNNGAGSNANDSGIVIERGSTGDNAFMGWDESADKFIVGTTTATGASTGDLTISSGTLVANTFEGALSGNATTATALATGRTISLTGDVTGTSGSFDGSGNVSISATIAANSVALGTDTTGNYVGAGATSGSGISGSVSSEGGTFTVTSNATSANTANTIVFRDGSGNFSAGVITGTSTSARYADLAEKYDADEPIEPGTVVHFAGEGKVAECDTANCKTVAGVISTDPAYLMNSALDGGVELALTGRVPCKVTGVVNAGDLMVSAGNGRAMANNDAGIGTVIGKAIEANEGGDGVIEVLITMM